MAAGKFSFCVKKQTSPHFQKFSPLAPYPRFYGAYYALSPLFTAFPIENVLLIFGLTPTMHLRGGLFVSIMKGAAPRRGNPGDLPAGLLPVWRM